MNKEGKPRSIEAAFSQIGHARVGVAIQIKRLRDPSGDLLHDAEFLLNRAKRLFDLSKEATQAPYPTPSLDRLLSNLELQSLRDRIKYIRDTSEHWIEYGQGVGKRQSWGEPLAALRIELSRDKPEIPISYFDTTVTVGEIERWTDRIWEAAEVDLS
jgi:hypothetical protein